MEKCPICKKFFLSNSFKYFIFPLLINIILFALFFFFATPKYQTNDDNAMEAIASGLRTGQPSEYLIFINVLIGKLLVFLYSNYPALNWYPILFYLIHFISMTIILHCLLSKKNYTYGLAFYLLIFVFFELFLLANLQFTTTAFISGISGIILFLTYIDSKGFKLYFVMSSSIILLILAGLIRHNVLYLVLGISSVVILLKFIKKPKLKIPVFIIILIVLFTTFYQYNNYYYNKDPQWKFYMEYDNLRHKIIGYPRFIFNSSTKDVYNAVGWSENDVSMIMSWFYNDLEIYPKEKLQYVVDNIKSKINIKETFKNLKNAYMDLDLKMRLFTAFFLIIMILEIIRRRNKYLYLILVPSFLISLYFSYLGRLPDRVFIPIILSVILISIFFIEPFSFRGMSNTKKIVIKITTLAICIFIVAAIFISTSYESQINKLNQKKFETEINKMIEKNKIYFIWIATLQDRSILFNASDHFKNLKSICQGWIIHSPIYNEILDKYSINNIYKDIAERSDIYVITKASRADFYCRFMSEHYGEMIEYEKVDSFDGANNIYKFNTIEKELLLTADYRNFNDYWLALNQSKFIIEDYNIGVSVTGEDPWFESRFPIEFKNNLPLLFKIFINSPVDGELRVFYGRGTKEYVWEDSMGYLIHEGDNTIFVIIPYDKNLKKVRIDPIDKNTNCTIKKIEIYSLFER